MNRFGINYTVQSMDGVKHIHFLGTDHWGEWIINAWALPWKTSIGIVHLGWFLLTLSKYKTIRREIGELDYTLSGHSLGGALALLYAAIFKGIGRPPLSIHTFGSPRPGFRSFRRHLEGIYIVRHRYGRDWIVPSIPFFLWGYVHSGIKKIHKTDDKFRIRQIIDHHQPFYYGKITDIVL